MKRVLCGLLLAASMLFGSVAFAPSAHASAYPPRIEALFWAKARSGCWYSYGGESCSPGFDCSGLVQRAYAAVGISLPRTTYAMLASPKLIRIPIQDAVRGDLMFFGSGHVELKAFAWHETFGALEPGTRLGFHTWGGWWSPTAAYRVRGAG